MTIRIIKKGNIEPTAPEIKPVFDGVEIVEVKKKGVKGGKKKKKVVRKYPLTDRQRKVVALVGQGRKSRGAILKEAGYAPSIVDHPKRVFDKPEVAKAVEDVIKRMERNRDRIIDALATKDMTKENAFNLSMMMNMHNKDVQLLSGLPTSREEYQISPERKAKLKELLKMNS